MHVQSLSQASSDIKYASNNFGACIDKLVVRQNFFKKNCSAKYVRSGINASEQPDLFKQFLHFMMLEQEEEVVDMCEPLQA